MKPLHFFATLALLTAPLAAQEAPDLGVLARIRDEATTHSHVGATFNQLASVIGPRLTGSPGFKRAVDWSTAELKHYGLSGVHQESWPFGRGWALDKLTLEMIEPWYFPLTGFPEGWTPSTRGELVGAPIYLGDDADSNAVRARGTTLRGAIVLATGPQTQFITADRAEPSLTDSAVRIGAPPFFVARSPAAGGVLNRILRDLGAGVMLRPTQGQHGTSFVLGNRATPLDATPSIVLVAEQYNLLVSILKSGTPLTLRARLDTRSLTADTNGYNVIAEIPGTDPKLKDEVILLGAHLDSWHSATGATDNADAAASLIEAMRVLKAIGVQPRRTIRMALWGGEEEGLLGSGAYAAAHLAGPEHAAERAKLVLYLNSDPGTGPIYGWYMEENAGMKATFDAWLEPLKALGARRNVIAKIGNTDHVTFNALGIPGFNSLQDYRDYDTREHHTNMDFTDRVNVADLRQNAVVLAFFAWQAANR